ncbi:MAG TPA: transglutaminase domain-containing protein [Kofleriaceae bacterium]|jgi:transglutaminase-like putative cysteine protease|nr:transglutaminase domain-containing protein [Kofleriaceae bacterium]
MSVAVLAACAAAPPRARDAPGDAPAATQAVNQGAIRAPRDAERDYAIWLGGAQVGTAHEVERWSPAGVVLVRTEALRFLRGNVPVAITAAIEITADRALAPSRVTWTERAQATRRREAVRDAAGWTVTDGADALPARLPAAAIPAELAPLLVRRDGRFAGPVFLPARGFVAGAGRIEPIAPRRLIARMVFDADPAATAGATAEATAEATIDLGDDAMPVRVVDGEGVIATRITAAEAAAPFAPVDLIAATAIPLAGAPGAPPRLVLEGDLVVPPVPGQAAQVTADGIELALSPRLGGGLPPGPPGPDRTREILWLVARVHRRIAPDLAVHPATLHAAAAATAGDCTTFALAYAALAAERAIPTRVVTGFRVDGDHLVRHRWAVSWTGGAWIAVDAAFGAVPAGGDLVGLAVHGADDVGLVAGEAALTRVRAAAWR